MQNAVGRPTFHQAIGVEIKGRRKSLRLSLMQVAIAAKTSKSMVAEIEAGKRKNPRPDVLVGIAKALRRPPDWLVRRFVAENQRRSGVTTPVVFAGETSDSPGGLNVTAAARILELETQLAERDATLERLEAKASEIEPIVRRLFAIAIGEEDPPAAGTKAPSRRAHRKTG